MHLSDIIKQKILPCQQKQECKSKNAKARMQKQECKSKNAKARMQKQICKCRYAKVSQQTQVSKGKKASASQQKQVCKCKYAKANKINGYAKHICFDIKNKKTVESKKRMQHLLDALYLCTDPCRRNMPQERRTGVARRVEEKDVSLLDCTAPCR